MSNFSFSSCRPTIHYIKWDIPNSQLIIVAEVHLLTFTLPIRMGIIAIPDLFGMIVSLLAKSSNSSSKSWLNREENNELIAKVWT
jgi:hypothetical protein